MKMIRVCLLAVALVCQVAVAQEAPIVLNFLNTDAAEVLKAIGLKTGYSIVYSVSKRAAAAPAAAAGGQGAAAAPASAAASSSEHAITISIKTDSIEEAVKSVAAAAGLRYRKVGKTFVVSDDMQAALTPFSYHAEFNVGPNAAKAAAQISAAIPYSIVSSSTTVKTTIGVTTTESVEQHSEVVPDALVKSEGDRVYMTGVMEDLAVARRIVAAYTEAGTPESEVVNLRYADPKAVTSMITSALPRVQATPVAATSASSGPGSVVLSGYSSDIADAKRLIAGVDTQSGPHGGEALAYRVYQIRYSSAPVLIDFLKSAVPEVECIAGPASYSPIPPNFNPITSVPGTSGSSAGGGSGSGGGGGGASGAGGSGGGTLGYQPRDIAQESYKPNDRSKTIVLRGPESLVSSAMSLLAQLDVKPAEVAIQVKVIDTTPQFSDSLGLGYTWDKFNFLETHPGASASGFNSNSRPLGFGQFARVPWSFQALLTASVNKNETKILADPNILVTDNDQAQFFVGDTLRVAIPQAGALGAQTVTVQEFPIGIIMVLRPRVNADGNITMRVHPVVSSITSVSANGLPQSSEREADTTIVTHDGETIVIGGLIRDEDSRIVSGIPILSQIPIIGELFQTKTHNKSRKEVLVFITSHIVKDGDTNPNPFNAKPVEPSKADPPKKGV